MNKNILVRLIGHLATVIHGDTAVFDRWLWLRKNLKEGPWRTLDAGCGSGAFALYAVKKGNEVVGISFDGRNNTTATERASILGLKNAKFLTMNLNDIGEHAGELGKFDQVICFETIEHILADAKLIKNLSHLLKPGGRLLLTAPYKNYHTWLLGESDASFLAVEDGRHVRKGYTHEEMEAILNEAGIEVEKKSYITGFISQLLVGWGRVVQNVTNYKVAWLAVLPFRLMVVLDPLVTKLIRYPHLSIGVVGRKIA